MQPAWTEKDRHAHTHCVDAVCIHLLYCMRHGLGKREKGGGLLRNSKS